MNPEHSKSPRRSAAPAGPARPARALHTPDLILSSLADQSQRVYTEHCINDVQIMLTSVVSTPVQRYYIAPSQTKLGFSKPFPECFIISHAVS